MSTTNGTAKVYVGSSGIHGKGLFAARNIGADRLILRIEGEPTERDGTYVLWWEDDEGFHGLRITNEVRFVNHDPNPNAALFEDGLYSLRAIRKGEEITHDYGEAWE